MLFLDTFDWTDVSMGQTLDVANYWSVVCF